MKSLVFLVPCVVVILAAAEVEDDEVYQNPQAEFEHDPDFWRSDSIRDLNARVGMKKNEKQAKNVIFFVGDGMGISTVTAGRIYKGQKRYHSGEEGTLAVDTFPYISLAKTYSADHQTTDSAASSTAYLCGVKTNNRGIGVTSNVKNHDCNAAADPSNQVDSILSWAQKERKWTGIVTNDEIVGASPAGSYAHVSKRSYMNSVSKGCKAKDIARQLIEDEPGSNFRVIMGGGRRHFLPKRVARRSEWRIDSSNEAVRGPGDRSDDRNLVEEWLASHSRNNLTASYIWNKQQLQSLHEGDYQGDYFFGLFAEGKFKFTLDKIFDKSNKRKDPVDEEQPTLQQMTAAAINILQRSPTGYVLFVENHNIDAAHHGNLAGYALEEVYQLDRAILTAHELTSLDDTLTIVTADHSHSFTLNGYSPRGADILGETGKTEKSSKSYSTLSYAAGPGASADRAKNMHSVYTHRAMVYLKSGVHGGEDVAVYAKGPWAHLFTGSHENTFIPIALAYAACLKQKGPHCDTRGPLSRVAHLRDDGNQTILDHINGRTIAPDVVRPSLQVGRKVVRKFGPLDEAEAEESQAN